MDETIPQEDSEQDPDSNVPRRQLGRRLADLRERAGLSTAEAAKLMDVSRQSIWRFEAGKSPLNKFGVKNLCEIYGADPAHVDILVALAAEAKKYGWHTGEGLPDGYDLYFEIEKQAESTFEYEAELVPGLLQTRDYAVALFVNEDPDQDEAELEQKLDQRFRRQRLLDRRYPLKLDAVLSEGSLCRIVGNREIMARQFAHLVYVSTRDNISIRILPFSAGAHRSMGEGFIYLQFRQPNEPDVVYHEGRGGGLFLDRVRERQRYRHAMRDLLERALSEDDSRELIAAKAREYMHDD